MAETKNKLVIVGGGFAGVKAALDLSAHKQFDVTLVSDQDSFRYYPTLYHTATGGNPVASSIPLAEIFAGKPVKVIKDKIKSLDREAKQVSGQDSYKYDVLILAMGVVTNYFGIKGLDKYSFGIKSQADAQELRDHIHNLLLDEGKPDLNYVVIGGGPTGVELAGALPGYIKHVMKMHKLPPKQLHIDVVEAAPRLMGRMPRGYSQAIANRLRRLGVKLYLNQAVAGETTDALLVGDHSIKSHTVIWTAGVTNHPFFSSHQFDMSEHNKVHTDQFLQAEPNIYVIGDNAETKFSGMAQTALYDARFVADNLVRQAASQPMRAYKPKKPIYVTPAGDGWAAVLWNKVHLYGWLGWVLRSAADARAFHYYEPWWQARQHWIAEYEAGGSCPICAGRQSA